MSEKEPASDSKAGVGLRACALLGGAVCLVAGSAATVGFTRSLIDIAETPYTLRETLFVCVWLVFTISTAAAGVSLLLSGLRGRRHNLIPGPTLYLAGVSLVIVALFLVEAGAFAAGLLVALAGAGLMVAEYRSATL